MGSCRASVTSMASPITWRAWALWVAGTTTELSRGTKVDSYPKPCIVHFINHGATQMNYDIEYDSNCECYVWWHNGAGMCLAAETYVDAVTEVDDLIEHDIYPENTNLPEGEEGVEYYDDSMDGDATSALASAGWGTDED